MKTTSIRYQDNGGVELIEIDVPEPAADEIQVKGAVCGICAWDLSTYKKGSAAPYAAPPGHEGMGYVTKVGRDVTGIKEGDRVLGRGFGGHYNMPGQNVYHLPDCGIEDHHWLVEPTCCVVNGLDLSNVRPGDRIAVIGCGYMGLMLVQGLGHSFAEQVIAIDINTERLDLALQQGATEAINAGDEQIDERLAELKDRGIDTVIDSTGAQAGLDTATKIVKRGGLINLFGWNRGPATFSGDAWHIGGFTVINSSPAAGLRDSVPAAIRMLTRRFIDMQPLVTHVVPLSDYDGLLSRVTTGQQADYIKGVVRLH